MKLSAFYYNLPPELIATEPSQKRDESRLLILDKKSGRLEHKHFFDLLNYLQPGDLLIANNSKVIPARLLGHKESGGEVEVFLSKNLGEFWECLIKGRAKVGTKIILSDKLFGVVDDCEGVYLSNGTKLVRFNLSGSKLMAELERIGQVPLPPYIIKARQKQRHAELVSASHSKAEILKQVQYDKENYQTVYADNKKKGSVAAPTAGLHFTPELLAKIKDKGVGVEYLTLHVGLGTFLPVKTENITEHKIHSEYAEVSAELIAKIIATKKRGGKIIAVGTTTARTLEYLAKLSLRAPQPGRGNLVATGLPRSLQSLAMTGGFFGWVDIFIYPPFKFKIVDALITNFHLPKSTLLMLVSALAGKSNIDKAYQESIKAKYSFYSYGDAMLIVT